MSKIELFLISRPRRRQSTVHEGDRRVCSLAAMLIICSFAFSAYANEDEIFSFKKGEKVEILSNTVEYYSEQKIAKFLGDVEAKSDNATLLGDQMIVTFKKSGTDDAKQSIEKIDIIGNVHITKENDEAFGDTGEYLVEEDIIKIVGNVKLRQDKNWMYGDELIYRKSKGEALLKSKSPSGRTKAVIWPKEEQK